MKKKMFKRVVLALLFFSMIAAAFAGCEELPGTNPAGTGTSAGNAETTAVTTGKATGGTTAATTAATTVATTKDPNLLAQRDPALNELFTMLENDAAKNSKMKFFILDEELHFELKNSEKYDGSEWSNPRAFVFIVCNYEKAVGEDWYQQSAHKDKESLAYAFCNHFEDCFAHSTYDSFREDQIRIHYFSVADFEIDYSAIKTLIDLEYVEEVSVFYQYGFPEGYAGIE